MGAQERARKARRAQHPREELAWRMGLQDDEPLFHLSMLAQGLREQDVEPSTPTYYDAEEWPPSPFWAGPSGRVYEWDEQTETFVPFAWAEEDYTPPPGLIDRIMLALGEAGAWPEDVPVSDRYL